MEFIKNYPVANLVPAEYNPRKIKESAFDKLIESIKKFGIIKPIIINGKNGILTAGHQRTKAIKSIGLQTVPVIKLPDIVKSDEIMFNLFHNSIETGLTKVNLKNISSTGFGYSFVKPYNIDFVHNRNSGVVKEISKLLVKYDSWGSVVCDESGRVILNSDYAVACKLLNKPLLVYKLSNIKAKEFLSYLSVDYGEYCFDSLGIKDYNQTFCQMNRLEGEFSLRSTTYTNYVLPRIKKIHRILDFGAGKCAYAQKLREQGFKTFMYEPFFKGSGAFSFKIEFIVNCIKEIQKDIKQNGLYDIVVLDSVINSVTNNEMRHYVLLACNSLLNDFGTFIMGTRSMDSVVSDKPREKATTKKRLIEFLDKDNYSATFRNGVWTKQHFHTRKSLFELLSRYFGDVEIYGAESNSNIYAVCKKPIRWDIEKYAEALNTEFNMTYPKGFKHNQHKDLVREILQRLKVS